MAVYDNMNYSYDQGVSPTLQDYFQRQALKNVQPNLGYASDAQMIEQPEHNGKHVHFHRFTELPAITKPLYEGVTPDGQKLQETEFTVMTKPYGGYIPYTDEFDLFHIDNMTKAMSDRLNNQARLSIDTIVRDEISAGLNVMYPGSVTSRAALTKSNVINYAVIKRVVRKLKKAGAQPFSDGYYHAKVDHDTYFDLTQDQHWIDVATYQSDTRVQQYELGTIYKVKFFEVDNGKTFTNETYLYGTKTALTATAFDAASRTMTVSDTISEDEARELTGKMVYVQYTKTVEGASTNYVTPMCVEYVDASAKTVKFRWVPSVTTDWTTVNALKIVPSGGASNGDEVHATLIYGRDAYGIVQLGGRGTPNIQTIVKAPGSSGSDDPLNQRGTIAWKVKHFCAAIIQDDFIVRVEHGVSD
jgi:N4-gp56 family major capsid protein